jgi:hypothetical protein
MPWSRALDLAKQLAGSGWAVPASPTRVTVVVEVWQNKVYFSSSDFPNKDQMLGSSA